MRFDEERFRRDLRAAAESERPQPGALGRLRARVRARRRRAQALASASAVAVVAALALFVSNVGAAPPVPPPGSLFGSGAGSAEPSPSNIPSLTPPPVAGERAGPPAPHDVEPNNWVEGPALSSDGARIAFATYATNLVPGDTNGSSDIFVRARGEHRDSRVSISTGGAQANDESWSPVVSGDGTHVAFWSAASNLVDGDTNDVPDVFVRDMVAHTTTRASVSNRGGEQDTSQPLKVRRNTVTISDDGRYVAFQSTASTLAAGDTNGKSDCFVRDTVNDTIEAISVDRAGRTANGDSEECSISGDGSLLAFASDATDILPSDAALSEPISRIYLRDLRASTTTLVSRNSAGPLTTPAWAPRFSHDGDRIVFATEWPADGSGKTATPQLFVFVRADGASSLDHPITDCPRWHTCASYFISDGGRWLIYNDGDLISNCLLLDLTGTTASKRFGECGPFGMTADGSYIGLTKNGDAGCSECGAFVYDRSSDAFTEAWRW
jgi:Tol biopolymer transport system component